MAVPGRWSFHHARTMPWNARMLAGKRHIGLGLLEELFVLAQNSFSSWTFFQSAFVLPGDGPGGRYYCSGVTQGHCGRSAATESLAPERYLVFQGGVIGIRQEPHKPSLSGRPTRSQKAIPCLLRDKLLPNQVFSYSELQKHFQRYYSRQVSSHSTFPAQSKWLLKYLLFVERAAFRMR